jgi:hypothetical protein
MLKIGYDMQIQLVLHSVVLNKYGNLAAYSSHFMHIKKVCRVYSMSKPAHTMLDTTLVG